MAIEGVLLGYIKVLQMYIGCDLHCKMSLKIPGEDLGHMRAVPKIKDVEIGFFITFDKH